MRNRFIIAFVCFLIVQTLLLLFVFGSPAQQAVRAIQPTPSKTPIPPPPPFRATAIPTMIPAYLAAPTVQVGQPSFGKGQCQVYALDVMGAWVKAGKPETAAFEISGQNGKTCLVTFEKDVLPLFVEPNIWYGGSLACASCHNANLELAAGRLAMNNYANILAGSRRASASQPGTDILGSADTWEKSKLHLMVITRQMPIGRPFTSPEKGPMVRVGEIK